MGLLRSGILYTLSTLILGNVFKIFLYARLLGYLSNNKSMSTDEWVRNNYIFKLGSMTKMATCHFQEHFYSMLYCIQ